jgi:hypothetical protein
MPFNQPLSAKSESGNGLFESGYKVSTFQGCKFVFGDIPLRDASVIMQLVPDGILDFKTASLVGAKLVIGTKEAIERIRALNLPPSERRKCDELVARQHKLPESICKWLLTGDRTPSSKAMCKAAYGFPVGATTSHPSDSDDFSHCIEFLYKVPDSDRGRVLQAAGQASTSWGNLVAQWDSLESLFLSGEQAKLQDLIRNAVDD